MNELSNRIVRTICGKPFDLSKAAPLASNKTAPYGTHNFIGLKTGKGFYLKGFNTGSQICMLNAYELISHNEAMFHLRNKIENKLPAI